MENERSERLLEEIRNLQREHLDLYKQAFENQRRSVEAQREAIAYQKRMGRRLSAIVLPVLALVIALAAWLFVSVR